LAHVVESKLLFPKAKNLFQQHRPFVDVGRGAIRWVVREIHPVFVEAGDSMDVELEGVFAARGLGHFAFLRFVHLADKEQIRDGLGAQLDGYAVTVADIAPRSLDVHGAPRLDVVAVKFHQSVDIEEWNARRGTLLAFDLA
jgi:hypothetical protein